MSAYFLETSALVKRHLSEPGTAFVESLADVAAGHTLYVSELARVEAAAAIAARHRAR